MLVHYIKYYKNILGLELDIKNVFRVESYYEKEIGNGDDDVVYIKMKECIEKKVIIFLVKLKKDAYFKLFFRRLLVSI